MHGVVFASLHDYTVERLGEQEADRIWGDRIFDATMAYDDEWFAAQLERLVDATGQSRADVERDFGAFAGRVTFAGLFPDYYADSGDVLTFLLGVEHQIHEVVRATITGATPPKLHIHPFGEEGVLISYTSERGLCRLLEGLVLGTAAELGDAVAVEEIQCMHRSDPGCVFTVVRSGT